MRALIQRVSRASVTVEGEVLGAIDRGLLVLLGIAPEDGPREVDWMVRKISGLRIFPNEAGRFDRSLVDVSGSVLLVSQFTLFGDSRKGRRPNFSGAARPEHAAPMCDRVAEAFRIAGVPTEQGRFGADMQVALVNDGPVTLMLDTP
ncbi:MAG TPA: D-tyrosyl-tRNA(Tyr) deacylase [Deltaproteobacteria bacterium]|nr:D-tyrosyl-tRNA(Tyr) deacylase [Deltaproteobacteria bacterium]